MNERELYADVIPRKFSDNIALWAEFNEVSAKYGCTNLGQGTPIQNPPDKLVENLVEAIREGHNQYASCFGHPILRQAIATRYSPKFGREIDPMTEIAVCNGANGTLDAFMQGLAHEGDEIVTIEPFFPQYIGHAVLSRANLKSARLVLDKDDKWQIDFESLEAAMSDKTRILVINTPQNPTGKVFTKEELERITAIVDKYPRCFVLSDEVYDFLAFDGRQHLHFAAIGDNWKRTISIFSGGKMFNCTGWKVGWGIGPRELVRQAVIMNDTINFCTNIPSQVAMAKTLPWLDEKYESFANYSDSIKEEYTAVRDYLVTETRKLDIPIRPIEPEGGYFLLADVSECRDLVPKRYFESMEYEDGPTSIVKNDFGLPVPLDMAVCRWLMMEKRVTAMPATLFYAFDSQYKQDNIIRLGICRSMKSAVEAIKRLAK